MTPEHEEQLAREELGPLPECPPEPLRPDWATAVEWNIAIHAARNIKDLRERLSRLTPDEFDAVMEGLPRRWTSLRVRLLAEALGNENLWALTHKERYDG
jgi:hypothetical protein